MGYGAKEVVMKRTSLVLSFALAAAIIVGAAASPNLHAQEQQEYISKAKSTPLLKTTLAGMKGKEVKIVHFAAPPGFVGEKHFHPGHVFIYILEGSLIVKMEGGAPRKLGPGDVFQEPQGRTMLTRILSSTHGVKLLVFQIGDEGKPLMIKAK